jgi:hypothetical protein
MFFSVFLCRECVVRTNGYVRLVLLMLCLNIFYEYSVDVCWLWVELCVLIFCIVIIYDVKGFWR